MPVTIHLYSRFSARIAEEIYNEMHGERSPVDNVHTIEGDYTVVSEQRVTQPINTKALNSAKTNETRKRKRKGNNRG